MGSTPVQLDSRLTRQMPTARENLDFIIVHNDETRPPSVPLLWGFFRPICPRETERQHRTASSARVVLH